MTIAARLAKRPDLILCTREEAGRILGITTRTVSRLMASGALRTVGSGSGKKIVRESLYAYCGVAAK